ncbi:hypothetical protein Ga0466249_001844 [Sporomusaceae bacterium BoRhaA]|nr:hypothetical protein [Pelorhabdus rhamnosifermentans]
MNIDVNKLNAVLETGVGCHASNTAKTPTLFVWGGAIFIWRTAKGK